MRALIAMSGGVDSSVAAHLAVERGYDCAAVTMRQFCGGDYLRQEHDAAQVAAQLGIPHTVLDFTQAFRREVMDRFVAVYESGGTPNPCLDCNRRMRAGHLLDYARTTGYDVVVTGHYARIDQNGPEGRWRLLRGVDSGKDQAYVHYAMTQDQLAHTRFPLGELSKEAVRALAAQLGFATAQKRDSQDICFVPDGDYGAFLEDYTGRKAPPGDFVDPEGRVIGRHRGAVRYTVGQRRGLGLAAEGRRYVLDKDMARNTVTVGPEEGLFARAVAAEEVNWIISPPEQPIRAGVQTRYRQPERPATVSPLPGGCARVVFDTPQRAPAPGQAVVFYQGEAVLGGGRITEAIR